MANPQKENGFVPVANEIYEALARIRIAGEARQVLDLIIRKTYGFNKKEDCIALSQMTLGTGLKKAECCRSIRKLLSMNLIVIGKYATLKGKTYRFNKDFDSWKPLAKKPPIGKNANKSLAKMHTTIDNIQNTKNADFSAVVDFFSQRTLQLKGFKPDFGGQDGKILKATLRKYAAEEIKDFIEFYLTSKKSDDLGVTLSIALSNHSINLCKQKSQTNNW